MYLHDQILMLNGSKFFAGIVMITLNICSRFINIKLSKTSENLIKNNVTKQLLIFSISWMGTRDIYTALILTAIFTIIFDVLFNEDSSFCVIPEKYRILYNTIDTNGDGVISEDEIKSAMSVLEQAHKNNNSIKQKKAFTTFHSYLPSTAAITSLT